MSNYTFKVGDKVEWNGMFGVVLDQKEDDAKDNCVLGVKFEPNGAHVTFTRDGRFFLEQTAPVLKLVEKAKTKKVVELVEVLVNNDGYKYYFKHYYPNEKDIPVSDNFTKYLKTGRTITVEVEE